jgi:DHA1 family tetracycline resistance protein-like MFS transporter
MLLGAWEGKALRTPVISRLMLVTFLAGCAFNGTEYVFGLWTQARFSWGPQQVGSAFAVVGIVAAINQIFLTGRLSKRFGEARVLAVGMALTMVFTALQAFSTGGWMSVPFLVIAAWGNRLRGRTYRRCCRAMSIGSIRGNISD